MLPYKRPIGREALSRVKVYVGIPHQLAGFDREIPDEAHMDRLNTPKFLTVGAVSTFLGAKF